MDIDMVAGRSLFAFANNGIYLLKFSHVFSSLAEIEGLVYSELYLFVLANPYAQFLASFCLHNPDSWFG